MSILFENDYGFFICHKDYINEQYKDMESSVEINPNLFNIRCQYKQHKNKLILKSQTVHKEQEEIKYRFSLFMTDFSQKYTLDCLASDNKDALETAEYAYAMSGKALIKNAQGANFGPATTKFIEGSNFLFPQNSTFFSRDISEIEEHLSGKKYDLILLDPPWWNKYIRRKRKKSADAYDMLFNDDIKKLPIESLLKDDGMVIVWCTNSQQHINHLLTKIFPKWNVKYLGKWYWVKITLTGEPVCAFSLPPGKQPYEQIIFGRRSHVDNATFDSKVVVSVPSAIHSHKPPLTELIQRFLPENPACLEIFARYLLPNWTSYGNEVLRLQHESLFIKD